MKPALCAAAIFFSTIALLASSAFAATVYTGDTVEGKKVISQLDVDDLAPGQIHKFLFEGVERGTGQRWYVPVMVAKGVKEGKRLLLVSGHLTDGLGNRVNFKNTLIIMTSNIGARFIQKKASMGFQAPDPREAIKSVSAMVLGEVKRTLNPEFINRIDEIIVFDPLSDEDLRLITRLLLDQLNANLRDRQLSREVRPEVLDWIIEVTCRDRSYGARPLRRAIQRYIEDPLAEELIRGHLRGGDWRSTSTRIACRTGWWGSPTRAAELIQSSNQLLPVALFHPLKKGSITLSIADSGKWIVGLASGARKSRTARRSPG